MNPVKKRVTVRFLQLEAESDLVNRFIGSFKSLVKLAKGADVVTNAQGRYVLHCINARDVSVLGREMLFWSSVKERNTWQVRAMQDGRITSIEDSNSHKDIYVPQSCPFFGSAFEFHRM